jgi:hypothetical protein
MSEARIPVGSYEAIDAVNELSEVEKQRVATLISEQSWNNIVWIPEWLRSEKDIVTVESADHLAVGRIEDYSEKAWRFEQRHDDISTDEFLPKSATVVFERMRGVEAIETPQQGLDAFGGDAQ